MKLKLDENLSRHLKGTLSLLRHDVATTAEAGLLSRTDTEVAAAAKSEDRLLLTLDVEFGNLTQYPPGSHPGIILFRPRSLGPLAVNKFIEDFFLHSTVDSLTGCDVVVDPGRARVRWAEQSAAKGQE